MRAITYSNFCFLFFACSAIVQATPTVYTGYDFAFTKAAGTDPANPANQDIITPNVKITRGNERGLYNAARESSYINMLSPIGTKWAFPHNNPGVTISAAAWSSLNFASWETAFGGSAFGGPPLTVGQNAVLQLVQEDVYLDIRFTQWGIHDGGSFGYVRSVVTSSASADFNGDGNVDGADFLIWQRNFGTGKTHSEGDADGDADVDADDLGEWQASYGGSFPANSTAVPEPSALLLALLGLASAFVRIPR